MSTLLDAKLLSRFSLQDMLSFLGYKTQEWMQVNARPGWNVFVSTESLSSKELEIALPAFEDVHTTPVYLASALDLLSSVYEEEPEIIAQRIEKYDSDVLYVRNLNTEQSESLPLEIASRQVYELRNLVRHSTNQEIRKLPYDLMAHSTEAERIVHHYRFGHTFRGSFGFLIESPLMHKEEVAFQRGFDRAIKENAPLSRRVMERLARGLSFARDSVRSNSPAPMVQNYIEGFNANMCSSILNLSLGGQIPLEYRILWSPVLQTVPDVADEPPIIIDDLAIGYIRQAEEQLRNAVENLTIEARGLVKELGSTDDPLGSKAERTVVIRWLNNPYSRRTSTLAMTLGAEAYVLADEAHMSWDVVLVEGQLKRTSKGWVLENPRNFRVENEQWHTRDELT